VQFARIANALAQYWAAPARCSAYFDDLLIDKRGTRRGFTIGIVHELAVMKNYYENVVHRSPQTVWDEVSARIRER
jgi:hypothetical protein